MTVFVRKDAARVTLQVRAEGDGILGDLTLEVRPGGEALGRSYDAWAETPDGPFEFAPGAGPGGGDD